MPVNFEALLMEVASSYSAMATGGAKPTADKLLAGVQVFLAALQEFKTVTSTAEAPVSAPAPAVVS